MTTDNVVFMKTRESMLAKYGWVECPEEELQGRFPEITLPKIHPLLREPDMRVFVLLQDDDEEKTGKGATMAYLAWNRSEKRWCWYGYVRCSDFDVEFLDAVDRMDEAAMEAYSRRGVRENWHRWKEEARMA